MPKSLQNGRAGQAEARAAEMVAALRRAGLRVTPQRMGVCQRLTGNTTHPTAAALYEALCPEFPSLSRATIYNTLQVLVEAGLIQELGSAGDGAIHYDADPSPHVNLMCTRCHRIDDFNAGELAQVSQRVAAESGYALRGARVVYYGLCARCQKTR